jgi:hypothetical protein
MYYTIFTKIFGTQARKLLADTTAAGLRDSVEEMGGQLEAWEV